MQCGEEEEKEECGSGDVGSDSEAVRAAKGLESQAVKQAEQGNLGAALVLLTQAISVAPEHPSSYNNRAQVRDIATPEHRSLEIGVTSPLC